MKRALHGNIGLVSLFCVVITVFALQAPMVCQGEEVFTFEFSPNNITLSSERLGEIRILTAMRYSFFTANGGTPFIYFGESPSIDNIKASRDSLGNLILRFSIEDLLALEPYLVGDAFNQAKVVIVLENGTEYIGYGEVYLNNKTTKK